MTTMFIIMAVVVYCIDISGFVEWFRERFTWRGTPLTDEQFDRPFFCSRCITFWAGLTLTVIYLDWAFLLWGCLLSWFAPYFCMLITALQDVFTYLYEFITHKLNR